MNNLGAVVKPLLEMQMDFISVCRKLEKRN